MRTLISNRWLGAALLAAASLGSASASAAQMFDVTFEGYATGVQLTQGAASALPTVSTRPTYVPVAANAPVTVADQSTYALGSGRFALICDNVAEGAGNAAAIWFHPHANDKPAKDVLTFACDLMIDGQATHQGPVYLDFGATGVVGTSNNTLVSYLAIDLATYAVSVAYNNGTAAPTVAISNDAMVMGNTALHIVGTLDLDKDTVRWSINGTVLQDAAGNTSWTATSDTRAIDFVRIRTYSSTIGKIAVDNVQLDLQPAPEPTTAVGFVGLGATLLGTGRAMQKR